MEKMSAEEMEPETQAECLCRRHRSTQISQKTVSFIECHIEHHHSVPVYWCSKDVYETCKTLANEINKLKNIYTEKQKSEG